MDVSSENLDSHEIRADDGAALCMEGSVIDLRAIATTPGGLQAAVAHGCAEFAAPIAPDHNLSASPQVLL